MPSSKRLRSRRSIAIVAGLAVIIIVGVGVRELSDRTSLRSNGAHLSPPAVPVTAAVATRKDVPVIVNAIGNVQSIDSVSVQPRVTGTIEKIEFTPGQDVKQGQELFLIDPRPYQAALDQAKAQLAHDEGVLAEAKMDLKRYQTLQQQKSIASQTAQDQVFVVQQDDGTVQLDQANVETAQLNLAYCHITAPISGRAGVLQVDLGNLVGPAGGQGSGTGSTSNNSASAASSSAVSTGTLVSITQLQPIYVSFSVPQTALNQIVQNQAKAPLEVDAYSQPGELIEKGKLSVINNQVSSATGTVTLQATFANPQESALARRICLGGPDRRDAPQCGDRAGLRRNGGSERRLCLRHRRRQQGQSRRGPAGRTPRRRFGYQQRYFSRPKGGFDRTIPAR